MRRTGIEARLGGRVKLGERISCPHVVPTTLVQEQSGGMVDPVLLPRAPRTQLDRGKADLSRVER
jgi:hypothetical protein